MEYFACTAAQYVHKTRRLLCINKLAPAERNKEREAPLGAVCDAGCISAAVGGERAVIKCREISGFFTQSRQISLITVRDEARKAPNEIELHLNSLSLSRRRLAQTDANLRLKRRD